MEDIIMDKNKLNEYIEDDIAKIINELCTENEIYFGIFNNLSDVINRGIEASTIKQIAKNIFEDCMESYNKKFGLDNFKSLKTIAS